MNLNFCLQLRSERAKRRVIRDFYCDVNPRTSKQTGEQRGSASHKNGLESLDESSILSADKPLHLSIFILLCQ